MPHTMVSHASVGPVHTFSTLKEKDCAENFPTEKKGQRAAFPTAELTMEEKIHDFDLYDFLVCS
jgi:hypothetical protein